MIISIGAVDEGMKVEDCACGELSGADGVKSGVSMGIIGVVSGVLILFFPVGLGSVVVCFGFNVLCKQKIKKIDKLVYNVVVCSLT